MSAWDAAIAGARNGALIGAGTGAVPLLIALFFRRWRLAAGGFAACILAGAIGGLPAAIAIMGVGIAPCFVDRARAVNRHPPHLRPASLPAAV